MEYSTLGGVISDSLKVFKLMSRDQFGFRENFKVNTSKTNTEISQ